MSRSRFFFVFGLLSAVLHVVPTDVEASSVWGSACFAARIISHFSSSIFSFTLLIIIMARVCLADGRISRWPSIRCPFALCLGIFGAILCFGADGLDLFYSLCVLVQDHRYTDVPIRDFRLPLTFFFVSSSLLFALLSLSGYGASCQTSAEFSFLLPPHSLYAQLFSVHCPRPVQFQAIGHDVRSSGRQETPPAGV